MRDVLIASTHIPAFASGDIGQTRSWPVPYMELLNSYGPRVWVQRRAIRESRTKALRRAGYGKERECSGME
jgi:hypothetical protein